MSLRLEILQQRMRDKGAHKAAKAVSVAKPKASRSVKPKAKPAPQPVRFDPKPTLLECVQSLTPAQAANPKLVAATVVLQLLDQLVQSSRPAISTLSDNALSDLAYITSQVWSDNPDLKQVFSRAVMTADSIEFRTAGNEGEGIARLHEIERALLQRRLAQNEASEKADNGVTVEC